MRKKEKIVEEFCKIASVVAKNLRLVKTFDKDTMSNKNIDEFLICDCFCDKIEWKKFNRIDSIIIEFIKIAVEDKILQLDVKHDLKDLD